MIQENVVQHLNFDINSHNVTLSVAVFAFCVFFSSNCTVLNVVVKDVVVKIRTKVMKDFCESPCN